MASQSVNIRNLFTPSGDNLSFIDSDWRQVENRVGAILTGETFLLDAFARGEDIYKKVYGQMFGVSDLNSITKAQRQIGKALVLGQNYDMTRYGLAKQLGCDLDTAQQYIEQYAAAHPKTQAAKANLLAFAKKSGYVSTYFGRRRFIKGLNSNDPREVSNATREVWNTYIQGTSADILKIAIGRLNALFRKRNRAARMVMPIHDEILVEADMMKEDPWVISEDISEAMEIKLMGHTLPVEPEWGWRFGSLTTDFEQFVEDTKNPEIKARFKDSKYWEWKANQEELKKKAAIEESPKPEEVKPQFNTVYEVPKKVYQNHNESLRAVENDFQKPAIHVTISDDTSLPGSFGVDLSSYKAEAGLYLYVTLSGSKDTFKYPSRVDYEVMGFLKAFSGVEIKKI